MTVKGVTGVVLAGGQGRRLGYKDKAFVEICGKPVIERVLPRLADQTGSVVINANGDPARFEAFGVPVVGDSIDGFAGPLAGVLAGMDWAGENTPDAKWIATIAVDTPFFPLDFVEVMISLAETENADLVCAASNGRHHPVAGLWRIDLADDLRRAMVEEDIRKVDIWTGRHKLAVCNFAVGDYDPFFNVNRPEDIVEAERILKEEQT